MTDGCGVPQGSMTEKADRLGNSPDSRLFCAVNKKEEFFMNKDNLEVASIALDVKKIRKHLHMYPELSGQEYKTSKYIKDMLDSFGIPSEIIGATGVIGTISVDKSYPTIAVRAEIDALPITEQTKADFQSRNPGVMHACGHDGIAATALGLANLLNSHKEILKCNVRFLFEPAEEIGQGAKALIKAKALENPKVDKIIVFHYTNSQPIGMEIQSGISTAIIGKIAITIKGKSSHWGERKNGIDAISVSAKVISAIDSINDSYPSQLPFVIGIGTIHGGIRNNIMADSVEMEGTLRAFQSDGFRAIFNCLKSKTEQIASETHAEIKVSLLSQMPAICNSPDLVKIGLSTGKEIFGNRCILGNQPYLAGDNAAYYFQLVKGLRIVFFAKKHDEENYPLHNSKFDFDEDIFPCAIATLYNLITSR